MSVISCRSFCLALSTTSLRKSSMACCFAWLPFFALEPFFGERLAEAAHCFSQRCSNVAGESGINPLHVSLHNVILGQRRYMPTLSDRANRHAVDKTAL